MRFTNIENNDEIVLIEKEEVYFDNGIPKTDKTIHKVNAKEYVDQAIRPIYRSGFKQI